MSSPFTLFQTTSTENARLDIPPYTLLLGLILFECVLVILYGVIFFVGIPSSTFSALFDLDREGTIPSWFSSMQLFTIGILILSLGYKRNVAYTTPTIYLTCIGAGFLFLSVDEAVAIHERITIVFRHIEWIPRFKDNHGLWIPVYLAVGLVFLLAGSRSTLTIWRAARNESFIILLGCSLFLLGAVGLEIASYQFLRDGTTPIMYNTEVAAEEFLEMCGASVILFGVILLHLREPLLIQKH